MKKIRIGNDIEVAWYIHDQDGVAYNLNGKDLVLTMLARDAEDIDGVRETEIKNFSRGNNGVFFTYYGKDQELLGNYTLKLCENMGEAGMKTLDIKEAFCLVPHSWQTGGEDSSVHLTAETVNLGGIVQTGLRGEKGEKGEKGDQGNSGYSGAAGELEVVNNLSDGGSTAALSAEMGKRLELDKADKGLLINAEEIDLSGETVLDRYITSENRWSTSTNSKHLLLSVTAGEKYRVTETADHATALFHLTSTTVTSGGLAPILSGTSKISVGEGETVEITIPSGAPYLYIYAGSTTDGGSGVQSIPDLYRLSSKVDTVTVYNNSVKESALITAEGVEDKSIIAPRMLREYTWFRGNGNTISGGSGFARVHGIVPGHTYRCFIENTDIPMTEVDTGTSWRFETIFVLDDDTKDYQNQVNTSTSLKPYYDAVAPEGAVALYIAGRCDTGYDFGCWVEDMSSEALNTLEGRINRSITNLALYETFVFRNGTAASTSDSKCVAHTNKLRMPVGTNKIYIYTDRPNREDCEYRYGFRTYTSTNTGVSQNNTGLKRDIDPSFAVTEDYLVRQGTENCFAFSVAEYNSEGEQQTLRVSSFNSYNIYVGFEVPKASDFEKRIAALEEGGSANPTAITTLNPSSEFVPKMQAAKKRYYTSTTNDKPQPYVIAHLSDIHGHWTNVSRFLEFCSKYSDYIDLKLNTGDTVTQYFDDGTAGYAALDGVNSIVNIIGNHDTRKKGTPDWRYYTGVEAYNAYIKPYVAAWSVTQPENAETNGYCYFYKDVAANSLRIIFVDIMGYDTVQDAWVQGLLASAKTAGYAVVIATHFAGVPQNGSDATFDKLACNWSTLYGLGSTSISLASYNPNAYRLADSVHAFMEGGGEFVGYIQGHYHSDFVAKVHTYPDQMIYSVSGSLSGEIRDWTHVTGTRSQDDFEIVSIDTYLKKVTLYKVGANTDLYGRHKNSISIKYTTGEIISEGF